MVHVFLEQVCKRLSTSSSSKPQYLLVHGSATRDRDNVWVDCTICSKMYMYEVICFLFINTHTHTHTHIPERPVIYCMVTYLPAVQHTHSKTNVCNTQASSCTPTQDAVCKRYTICDARYEYVLRKGNMYNDAICAPKTLCAASSSRSMYEAAPAVDSPSFDVNGTDAQCALYSTCPDGKYMSFFGDDTHDVRCTDCPAGTYRDAALFARLDGSNGTIASCRVCPEGTYSDEPGSSACKPCAVCSTANSGACAYPNSTACVPAARVACTATSDAQCTMCPVGEGFELRDGVCIACKPGYFYNASEPVEGRRCIPCPAGFYCPSRVGTVYFLLYADTNRDFFTSAH